MNTRTDIPAPASDEALVEARRKASEIWNQTNTQCNNLLGALTSLAFYHGQGRVVPPDPDRVHNLEVAIAGVLATIRLNMELYSVNDDHTLIIADGLYAHYKDKL